MSTVNSLLKRVDRMIKQVEQQRGPAPKEEEELHIDLLETEEQDQLQELLNLIPDWDLRCLTDIQLEQLEHYCYLLNALERDNEQAARKHRQALQNIVA